DYFKNVVIDKLALSRVSDLTNTTSTTILEFSRSHEVQCLSLSAADECSYQELLKLFVSATFYADAMIQVSKIVLSFAFHRMQGYQFDGTYAEYFTAERSRRARCEAKHRMDTLSNNRT
ncbi:hypothetical protein PENTCL1PPCAC_5228, partial [Pristionchus entomophagus]